MRLTFLIIIVFYSSLGLAQNVERAIKISKEVGRTIDSTECSIYKLDFCSEDFVSAQVISVSGSTMMLRITRQDTITETYFSPKDLTDLKIKVGDKKYSKETLEAMGATSGKSKLNRKGGGRLILGSLLMGAGALVYKTRTHSGTIDIGGEYILVPVGVIFFFSGLFDITGVTYD